MRLDVKDADISKGCCSDSPVVYRMWSCYFGITQFVNEGFVLFVVYEGIGLLVTLFVYVFLALKHQLQGAGLIAMG
jgi:hypothetical protein